MRSIKGMRNRSSAASRGDQQVLAAEGCSYAAAFNLAKNHDKHLLYCKKKYYSTLCMMGATPPLARNRLLAALLYSGRPASISSGTQYWGGNGRPGRPYGYGPEYLLPSQIENLSSEFWEDIKSGVHFSPTSAHLS